MSANANNGSALLQLPPELLVRVASYLTTPELGNLRRTCKDIEARLFESFAYEFFHKRQFMLEENSLEALVEISNHQTLSKRLTEVIISTHVFIDGENPRSTTGQRLYQGGYSNHSALVSSGQARDMLVEGFSKLPNLRKVGLRDYDARGRFRDGEDALWKSYGHSLQAAGPLNEQSPEQVWLLILHAIALSGANVPSIEVFLRRAFRLSDPSFDVFSSRMSKRMLPVLSQLRSLMLTIGADRLNAYPGQSQTSDIRLKRFLHNIPSLECLRLNFDDHATSLLDWLALSPASSSGPQTAVAVTDWNSPLPLASLTTLDLGIVRSTVDVLLKIFSRLPKLTNFNLWRITLNVDDRSEFKDPEKSNPATKFLEKMSKLNSTAHVECAMLGGFKVNTKHESRYRAYDIDFSPDNKAVGSNARRSSCSKGLVSPKRVDPKYRSVYFSLGGRAPNFTVWAKEMAERATVKRARGGYEIPFSGDENESDDSMGDDEEDSDELIEMEDEEEEDSEEE